MQGKLSTTELQPPHYATAFKLLVLNSKLAERTEGQAEFRFHRPVNCLGARLGKSSTQAVYCVAPWTNRWIILCSIPRLALQASRKKTSSVTLFSVPSD